MLSFFPTPYPDEFFYSIITRYHIRSGNRSFRQTLLELLEYSSRQSCNLDLPNNLERLVEHLPVGSAYSVERFIQEHTLYPFYRTFLTSSELWLLKDRMRGKLNDPTSSIAKIPLVSKSNIQQFLKFCPICLEKDIEKYGEAYWHRIHQIPGIFICLEHSTVLLNSLISTETASFHHYPASLENCLYGSNTATYASHVLQKLVQLSEDVRYVTISNFNFKGLQWLRKRYQDYLVKYNFIEVCGNTNFKFNQQKFLSTISDFYSQDFWEVVKPEVVQKLDKYLRYCLLGCDVNPTIDRTTHILLIRFLSNSIEEFFQVAEYLL